MNKWIDAPSMEDLQYLALDTGYAVRVDKEGFHICNINSGAAMVVLSADEVIDVVCRRTL